MTCKKFSEIFGIKLSKVRRWVRELLPPDPKATRRSGYTRELSQEQAWTVIIGGELITNYGFSFSDSRKIISAVREWMFDVGLWPGATNKPKHTFIINIGKRGSDFSFMAKESLKYKQEGDIITERYKIWHIEGSGRQMLDMNVTTFPISSYYDLFFGALNK